VTLLISIGGSVIAGVLVLLVGGVVSERFRWILTAALGRLVDSDVDFVYGSPRAAEGDVHEELGKARIVHLFAGRGNELQREVFAPVLGANPSARLREVKILLPCTDHPCSGIDWVEDRESELASIDPAFGNDTLRNQIRTSSAFLEPLVRVGRLEVRRYDLPHLGRILVTDRCAYLTPYPADAHGRNSKVIKYRRSGEMYEFLERTFLKIWAASHDENVKSRDLGGAD